MCKTPGGGRPRRGGGRFYDIVPGAPDASVIPYRMDVHRASGRDAADRQERRGRARPGAGHPVDRRDAGQLSLNDGPD